MKIITFILSSMILLSCSSRDTSVENYNRLNAPEGVQVSPNSSSSSSAIAGMDPYEVMETAFEGYPGKEEIKPMLEDVMARYGMQITNDNLLKAANVLVTMKNESKVGVTEMEILKHVYQHGSSSGDYVTNVAVSATILERTK